MSKVTIYNSGDFYIHLELEFMGTFEEVLEMAVKNELDSGDILFDDECRDITAQDISDSILNHVKKNYPDAVALSLIGSSSNWRGLFVGGSVMSIEGDIREGIFFRNDYDDMTIEAEEGETPLLHYSNHDWSSYMSLEVILKEHLTPQLVEDIEGEIFDEEEVMSHLLKHPRENPIYLPIEAFIGE